MDGSFCNRRASGVRQAPFPASASRLRLGRRAATRTSAAVVGAALAGAVACATAPPPAPGPGSAGCAATVEQRTLRLLNRHRAGAGLAPLLSEVRLARAAARHGADMARNGLASHRGSDGSDPSVRVSDAGYSWTRVAENVAVGQTSPDEVTAGWMSSPAHRRNILGADFQHVGIAMVTGVPGPGGERGYYWVTVFGSTLEPPEVPGDGCHPG